MGLFSLQFWKHPWPWIIFSEDINIWRFVFFCPLLLRSDMFWLNLVDPMLQKEWNVVSANKIFLGSILSNKEVEREWLIDQTYLKFILLVLRVMSYILEILPRFLCQMVNLHRMLKTPIGHQALYKHNSQEQTLLLNINRQKNKCLVSNYLYFC